MESNDSCPVPSTHNRLADAHRLWHQALDSYADVDGFRTNLNALIEALRNVTFILQSEKRAIPDFEPWYGSWQERMKADDVMSWLHKARNKVVKQSDLETASIAVAVLHNHLDIARFRTEVPPVMPTEAIAFLVAANAPNLDYERERLVLSVERQWSVADLPDRELLDVLAYAYGFLSRIVREAHELCGAQYFTIGDDGVPLERETDRLPCMVTTAEQGTARLSMADGGFLRRLEKHFRSDELAPEEVAKRYKLPTPAPLTSDDPMEYAAALVPIAITFLKKDKYHQRILHLRGPEGWQLREVHLDSREAKYAFMRSIAEVVRRDQIDAIIDIGEMWLYSEEDLKAGRLGEDAIDKKEALAISVATSDGRFRSFDTIFRRTLFGRIVVDDTVVRDAEMPPYMAPICKAWGLSYPTSE